MTLLNKIMDNNKGINERMVIRGLAAFEHPAITNRRHLIIVNFDWSDKWRRFNFIDAETGIIDKTKVGHGKESDKNKDNYAERFSNKENSRMSSLGAMRMAERYKSPKFGWARRIDGLDEKLNSNVRERAIVWHGTWYVNDMPGVFSGDTFGCFGQSYRTIDRLMNVVGGCLLYAYHSSLEE